MIIAHHGLTLQASSWKKSVASTIAARIVSDTL
jgi:hypothetical protein